MPSSGSRPPGTSTVAGASAPLAEMDRRRTKREREREKAGEFIARARTTHSLAFDHILAEGAIGDASGAVPAITNGDHRGAQDRFAGELIERARSVRQLSARRQRTKRRLVRRRTKERRKRRPQITKTTQQRKRSRY